MAAADTTPAPSHAPVSPKRFLSLLGLACVVGLVVSLAAFAFLQLTHYIPEWVYEDLPHELGYDDGAPQWWPLPWCALAGLITAFAIVRLPGTAGHVPAHGLDPGPTMPVHLPGVLLAATASIGLGIVLGPEAPLIALGAGLAILGAQITHREGATEVVSVMAAAGAFAAVSFIFESPLIAAVLLIEATGLGGSQLPTVLLPGLLAAGVGSLVSIGMGSWTGLDTSNYALGVLPLPVLERPDVVDLLWTVPFAVAVAVGAYAIMLIARRLLPLLEAREFLMLPLAGLAIGALAIGFSELAGKPFEEVLFSGEAALPGLVEGAETWSVAALAWLMLFKALAWSISLAGFRGGPIFPALFLGAAGGLMASHLAGFDQTAAVAVGMGAATVAILKLPLSAVLLATLLTAQSGSGAMPLVILGVVSAYLVTRVLTTRFESVSRVHAPGAPVAAHA
jgi:H+/Cl- antiporter ClcA